MTTPQLPYTANIEQLKPEDYLELVERAILEDAPTGDISSQVFENDRLVKGRLVAKQNGVICGCPVFEAVFVRMAEIMQLNDNEWSLEFLAADGQQVSFVPGEDYPLIARMQGPAHLLLRAERVALNFIGFLAGIATTTRRVVDRMRQAELSYYNVDIEAQLPHTIAILDTRKTLPGFRVLSKYAVVRGGGTNHRLNLSEMGMIKENHIRASGSIAAAARLFRSQSDRPFEIELTHVEQVDEVNALPAEMRPLAALLDNMDAVTLKKCTDRLDNTIIAEASGNYNESNIVCLVGTGVDAVSLGSITKHPDHFDFSMLLDEEIS